MREIPFSLVQFPLYEYMKVFLASSRSFGNVIHHTHVLSVARTSHFHACSIAARSVMQILIMIITIEITFFHLLFHLLSHLLFTLHFSHFTFTCAQSVIPEYQGGKEVGSSQAAVCGCLSGALAAAVTTPLDVIKTRLMLGAVRNYTDHVNYCTIKSSYYQIIVLSNGYPIKWLYYQILIPLSRSQLQANSFDFLDENNRIFEVLSSRFRRLERDFGVLFCPQHYQIIILIAMCSS